LIFNNFYALTPFFYLKVPGGKQIAQGAGRRAQGSEHGADPKSHPLNVSGLFISVG
jgi:hypothetical protein